MANPDKKVVSDLLALISNMEQNPNTTRFSSAELLNLKQMVKGYFSKPVGATSLIGDYHTHTTGSHDATGKAGDMVKLAKRIGIKELAITDHNKVTELQIYLAKLNGRIKEYNEEHVEKIPPFDFSSPIHNVNGVNVIPGVEVTCVIPGLKSDKGKPLKIHMLVYGLKLQEPSPLLKLLKAKQENDALVDFGLFKVIEKKYGISFSEEKIKEYIINHRQKEKGFGRFGADDVIEFLKYNNVKLANNYREVRELLKSAPGPERMQLNVNDVIKLAHASGGICVLAHPGVNLNRITPDTENGQTKEDKKAQIVRTLLNYGIDGFECYYNSRNIDKRERQRGERTTTQIIKDEVRDFVNEGLNRGNQIVYTAGSDTHFMRGDQFNSTSSLGTTNKGEINLEGVERFRLELLKLLEARLQGKITHREYKAVSKEEIRQIQQQYVSMAENFEKNYLEGVDNFTFTHIPSKVEKKNIKHKNSQPKRARNFKEFVLDELTMDEELKAEATQQVTTQKGMEKQ